ncbi:Transmembrane protein [Quillaja saponaria]|uniref:Transmembrane protein n=1 Tax=Quillaja saponaria TaxID=32244 RepID=A0AAD7QDH5_QUISA|nr:Transmembrane protein [Quillaja saponaria]KAJ7979531.1 Transmembrane protein [Quillaja saponaria]
MSEGEDIFLCFAPIKILFNSLKIFLRNKQIFISIFVLATLPLSFLIFSLSISTHQIRSQIYHLEAIARLSSTRFEARHVWHESRDDAIYLLRIKGLFFIPSYILSLIAAIAAVNSTATSFNGKRPSLQTVVTAVKLTWKRPVVATILVYGILLGYAAVSYTSRALTASRGSRFLVQVIGSGIEVYLMAVLSLGVVVSIMEDKLGWEAIKAGSGLMTGRRFCGWVLSGLFVVVSSMIASNLEMMDGQDSLLELSSFSSTVVIEVQDKMGLICLYGLAVLFSYVITTVFYCECRRRNVNRESVEQADTV